MKLLTHGLNMLRLQCLGINHKRWRDTGNVKAKGLQGRWARNGASLMQDKNGRDWARLSQLQPDDAVECDDGFFCLAGKAVVTIKEDSNGKYISCDHGKHYLAAQLETDGDSLIGLYAV
jgi:hypothetical protein